MEKERVGLKILRVKHKLTQKELAAKVGVSYPTYNLIEQGKRKGSYEFWSQLKQQFNLTDADISEMYEND